MGHNNTFSGLMLQGGTMLHNTVTDHVVHLMACGRLNSFIACLIKITITIFYLHFMSSLMLLEDVILPHCQVLLYIEILSHHASTE